MHGQPQHACAEPPSSALNMTLPAFAADRRRPSYLLLQSARQQTRRPQLLLSIDGTDRRTDTRPLHRPRCHRILHRQRQYKTTRNATVNGRLTASFSSRCRGSAGQRVVARGRRRVDRRSRGRAAVHGRRAGFVRRRGRTGSGVEVSRRDGRSQLEAAAHRLPLPATGQRRHRLEVEVPLAPLLVGDQPLVVVPVGHRGRALGVGRPPEQTAPHPGVRPCSGRSSTLSRLLSLHVDRHRQAQTVISTQLAKPSSLSYCS